MQATISRADIPFALIERIRRDVTQIGILLFQDSIASPMALTGKVFRFVFQRHGTELFTVDDSSIVRTTVNRLEITLTTAQKDLLTSGEFDVFLYEETEEVTLLEGIFRWVKARPSTAPALKNPPDIGIIYDSTNQLVVRTVLSIQGPQGERAWEPVHALVTDGQRRVLKVVDWRNGTGTKPTDLPYLGATGYVAAVADAIDIRGAQGLAAWTPLWSVVDDGQRKVIKVVDWTGGEGVKPAVNVYAGATGLTPTLANAVDIRGPQGVQGNPGTLTNSAIPARTTPISRTNDKMIVQRADNVLEKVTLFQMAGGFPLVTGNLITNGNGEFSDLSNLHTGNSNLVFDATQSPPAGGKGAFKYTGSNATLRTTDLIPVNLLRKHRLSVVARHGDTSGANYDANARCFFGIACYDSDGQEIQPPNWAKVTGTQTTLAAPLNPGDTTMTLASSANWHNGSSASSRGFAWYPYTSAQGQVYADYSYSRNVSNQYSAYSLGNGGAWAQGGIAGNVITLRSAWTGPALPTGTKVANVMEGGTYMYSSVLNNGLVPNAWTQYECYIQGVNAGNSEDPANLMFRPGTAFIRPIILINYNNPAATTTFYFTMLDLREVAFDLSTLLGGANAYTGNNTFAGTSTFNGDVTMKRLIAAGSAPTIAPQSGAGGGASASITAGSVDLAGTLTINVGTSPGTNVAVAIITFATALAAAPKAILLTARNNQAGMAVTRFYIASKSASSFTISSTDAAPSPSTAYVFDYVVIA